MYERVGNIQDVSFRTKATPVRKTFFFWGLENSTLQLSIQDADRSMWIPSLWLKGKSPEDFLSCFCNPLDATLHTFLNTEKVSRRFHDILVHSFPLSFNKGIQGTFVRLMLSNCVVYSGSKTKKRKY